MNVLNGAKNACVAGGLVVGLFLAGCATVDGGGERWTPPPLGSSWEVQQKNTGSYGKDAVLRFTRGDGVWAGSPVVTIANSNGLTTMTAPNGHWVAIVNREGKAMTSWDPPLGFEYPLTVGKKWATPYKMTLGGTGKTLSYQLACEVAAHEKVSVKAGTYDTFKVVCRTNIGNEETYWTHPGMGVFIKSSLSRSAASPFGPGTQETELLSAPSVSR